VPEESHEGHSDEKKMIENFSATQTTGKCELWELAAPPTTKFWKDVSEEEKKT